jgi:hypothetical protein
MRATEAYFKAKEAKIRRIKEAPANVQPNKNNNDYDNKRND